MSNLHAWRQGAVAATIGTLALGVGSIGVATAANGGPLILGHQNTATSTTTLKDSAGTPLELEGKPSKPPLKVNSSKQVKKLNASLLGGKSASQLGLSGSGSSYADHISGTELSTDNQHGTVLASTKPLKPGTYFVTASTEFYIATGGATYCAIGAGSVADSSHGLVYGNASSGYGSPALTDILKVTAPTTLHLYCYATSGETDDFYATIEALRLNSQATGTTVSTTAR